MQVFEATLGYRRHYSHLLIYNIGWDAAACLSWASLQVSLTPSLEGGGKGALGRKGSHLSRWISEKQA